MVPEIIGIFGLYWTLFRVVSVARLFFCPGFVLKSVVLEVLGILSIQCSKVSISGDVYVVLMTAHLNILPEFDRNIYIVSLLSEKGP